MPPARTVPKLGSSTQPIRARRCMPRRPIGVGVGVRNAVALRASLRATCGERTAAAAVRLTSCGRRLAGIPWRTATRRACCTTPGTVAAAAQVAGLYVLVTTYEYRSALPHYLFWI